MEEKNKTGHKKGESVVLLESNIFKCLLGLHFIVQKRSKKQVSEFSVAHLARWVWPWLESEVDVHIVARHTRCHRALVQGPGSYTLQKCRR